MDPGYLYTPLNRQTNAASSLHLNKDTDPK